MAQVKSNVGDDFSSELNDKGPSRYSISLGTIETQTSSKSLVGSTIVCPCASGSTGNNSLDLKDICNDDYDDDNNSLGLEESIYSDIIPLEARGCATPAWMCRSRTPTTHRSLDDAASSSAPYRPLAKYKSLTRRIAMFSPNTRVSIHEETHANAELIVDNEELWKDFKQHIRNSGPRAINSTFFIRKALTEGIMW